MNNLSLVKMATIVVIFTFLKIECLGQKEDNYWPLHKQNSIIWNNNQYTVGTSNIFSNDYIREGVSSICNKYGDLLYYSDGYRLHNKNHIQIDSLFRGVEIDGMWVYYSSAQGNIFLNSNENENKIHFITVNSEGQSYIHYNQLDTNDNVLIKNELLKMDVSEHLMANRHANGRDWWVITHSKLGDEYYTHLISHDTILYVNTQNTGKIFWGSNYSGTINFNNKGDQFVITGAQSSWKLLETLNYNRKNGLISFNQNYTSTLNFIDTPYSGSYSSNDSILLISGFPFSALLNLNNNNFISQGTNSNYHGNCKMRNNSFFISKTYSNKVHVIKDSNLFTFGSNLIEDSISTINGEVVTLPNHPNYALGPDLHPGFVAVANSGCTPVSVTVTDTSWGHFYRVWDWGDGSPKDTFAVVQHADYLPGLLDTFKTVSHTYPNPGTFTIQLQILNPYTPQKLPAGQFLKDTVEQQISICVPQGVGEKLDNEKIKIYPNPTSGEFTVFFGEESIKNIQIINLQGVKVFEAQTSASEFTCKELKLSKGLYIIHIQSENINKQFKLVVNE